MELKGGKIVSVRHYSEANPFVSIVQKTDNSTLILKLTKEFPMYSLFEGDPVVVGYQINTNVYVCECTIYKISSLEGTVQLKVDNYELVADKRVFERFPVSFYAGIKLESHSNQSIAHIKNLSINGMALSSKMDFDKGQVLEINAYIDRISAALKAQIMWKTKGSHCFEYGVKTLYSDDKTRSLIETYLKLLKEDQERVVKQLLSP